MSVNKLALNKVSEDFLNIELEVMDTLDYNSSKDDINSIVDDISASLHQHLFFLVKQRVEEQAKLKKNVFSNFTKSPSLPTNVTQVVKNSKPSGSFSSWFEQKIDTQYAAEEALNSATLTQVISALKKVDVLVDGSSYLENVYRLKSSPYAYTIKSTQWSSPFGSLGEDSLDLVNDISNNVLKHDVNGNTDFLIKLANAL